MKQKPLNSTWTDEQWEAIATRNTSILVSAGAGSGKTAVLTERILEILKEGHSILDLIVLTFTNAAAKEMKDRVKKKLEDAIKEGYTSLEPELQKIDLANICTFDSFSLNLVKKYHYLLHIEKDVKIGDSICIEALKKESIEETFHEFYEKKDKKFFILLDTFTVKDDTKIKDIVLSLADSLTSRIHIEKELEDCYKKINEKEIEKQLDIYVDEIKKQVQDAFLHINELLKDAPAEMIPILESLKEMLQGNCDNYESIASIFYKLQFPRLPNTKKLDEDIQVKVKEIHADVKKEFQEISNQCIYLTRQEYIDEVLKTKDTVFILKELLKSYFLKLQSKKQKENIYEFHDIGRFAIQILEENADIRKEYQDCIYEIMIDEYQDTNDIGTYFVSMIQNNNVYTVGDVKQSIYRFRNANPNIFMDKFTHYKENDGGKLITLSKNFRSRKEVVDAINFIFQAVMDEKVGGVHYLNQEEMIFGNQEYEEIKDKDTNYDLEVLDYNYRDSAYDKVYKKDEIEAFLIAQDIKMRIARKEMIKAGKTLRPVTYSDFAILQDRKSSFDLYKTIFTYLEIPITIHKEETFYASEVIYTVKSIIQLICCMVNHKETTKEVIHPFLTLSRSFLGGVSDDLIFQLLKRSKQMKMSIFRCMEEDTDFVVLYEKLNVLAEYAKTHTISSLLREVYHVFHIYDAVIQLGDVKVNSDKLVFLLNLSETLETSGYDLNEFVRYFEQLQDSKLDVSFDVKKDTDVDAVTLMTIHKSKGLEFPICYFSGLTKEFSKEDYKERFLYQKDMGMITPYFAEGVRETFYKKLFIRTNKLEDISERIRVFYVALTRAKEKMILVAPLSDAPKNKPFVNVVLESIRKNYNSLYDILKSIKELFTVYTTKIDLDTIHLTHDYEQKKLEKLDLKVTNMESHTISINEKKKILKHNTYSHHPTKISFEDMDKMEFGTKMHAYLEMIDFLNPVESFQLLNLSSFEEKKIKAFLNVEFMKNIQDYKIFHEYEFISTTSSEESNGIIDLLLVGENDIIIVDYKLKEIEKPEYQTQVRGYMKYMHNKLNLPVRGYLYSIIDETYIPVEQ